MAKKIKLSGVLSMATGVVRVKEDTQAPASESHSAPTPDNGKLHAHLLFYAIMAATIVGISVKAQPITILTALIVQICLIFLFVKSTVSQRT